jgi:hypothetical protein
LSAEAFPIKASDDPAEGADANVPSDKIGALQP